MSVSMSLSKLRIDELGPTQQEALRLILSKQADVVVLFPTGSDKTLARLLPLIQKIEVSRDALQAVAIVLSRELALQSSNILRVLSTSVRSYTCYGGWPTMGEREQSKQTQPQITFATPSRLNDHLSRGDTVTSSTQHTVIDEFDKCSEVGFQSEMKEVLTQLHVIRQRILLSATDADSILEFANTNCLQCLYYLDEVNITEQI